MSDGKIRLDMPVIVEGKYDKIKLDSLIDGIIITTDGFAIYGNKQKMALIRKYAKTTGIIILTDSDGAGFQLRNMLKSRLGEDARIVNLYIPDVFGKERRKDKPSKEGKLGVEGIDKETLLEAFTAAGVVGTAAPREKWADKQRLVDDGLSGGENSSELRGRLCARLKLPGRISAKGLLDALNTLFTEEDYISALNEIRGKTNG